MIDRERILQRSLSSETHAASTAFQIAGAVVPEMRRRSTNRPCKAIPALLEFRRIMLHPPQDGARCQGETAFGHHLDEVTVRKLVPQTPTHAQHDDLAIEMAALEEIVDA